MNGAQRPASSAAAGANASTDAGVKTRTKTKELIEYEEAEKKIEDMKKESEKYNNPDDYGKYGKMQR